MSPIEFLNAYLGECMKNSHKCEHCIYCHRPSAEKRWCVFAYDCFKDDQKFYTEDDE